MRSQYTYPGYEVPPFSSVSTWNWLSNSPGVESKGDPRAVGSTWSAAAIECLGRGYEYIRVVRDSASAAYDASKATSASGPKPASSKRSIMASTSSASYRGVPSATLQPNRLN